MSELAAALAAFQKDLPTVGKDKTATVPTKTGGQYKYTYTDLATLTHAVMPLLTKHGLSFSACPRHTPDGYELAGILLHTSGEKLEGSLPLHGRTPQEIGSAITYSRRYLLGAMTGVVTEDDDDAHRAQKAARTPAKDWQAVKDTAAGMSDVDALRDLWVRENVHTAPASVQAFVKQQVEAATSMVGASFPNESKGQTDE